MCERNVIEYLRTSDKNRISDIICGGCLKIPDRQIYPLPTEFPVVVSELDLVPHWVHCVSFHKELEVCN